MLEHLSLHPRPPPVPSQDRTDIVLVLMLGLTGMLLVAGLVLLSWLTMR